MYNNKHKQVIVAGNDFKIRVTLEKMEDTYVPFDLTVCSDLHVYLLSSKSVDLHYEILQDETGVILATVDYRLVSPNTGYGIAVEGIDENNHHFRWEMKPSEGFYVVTNSSSMHAGEDIYTLDLAGRVGWGDPGYTKAQIDEKFDAVGDDIDRIDQSIEGIDGDIAELDSIVDGLTDDVADLQSDVQQLQSGVQNINSEVSGIQTDIAELQTGITELQTDISNIENELDNKQDTLTPGNFIEIDDNEISAVGLVDIQEFNEQMQTKQDVLVSAQNIKTINNESILGAGNIEIQAASQEQADWNQTDIQAVDYIKNKPDIEGISQTVAKALNDHKIQIDTINSTVPQKIEELESNVDNKITEVNSSLSEVNTTVDLLSKASALANDELTNKTEELTNKVDELTDKVEELTIDYAKEYLTFEAVEDGTFSFTRNGTTADVYYSVDNGNTWTVLASGDSTPTVTAGNKILWKSDRTSDTFSSSNYNKFSSTGQFKAEGNIMSIIYGDNFEGQTSLANKSYSLYNLFMSCTTITNTENLILPATTLSNYCYSNMFQGCTSLTAALALPATTLTNYCYQYMFRGCTSLTTAPALPATRLATSCYERMFQGCTSLNYIKAMFITTPDTSYTKYWVLGVAATGTFVKNLDATWNKTGDSGVPTGWTIKYEDTGYVDKTPTDGSNNSVTSDAVYDALQGKQDTLIAGNNITIENNVISATGGGSEEHDYSKDYMTFEALQDGTFSFTRNGTTADVYYSVDNGNTWTVLASGDSTPTVTVGNKILWKSDRTGDTFDYGNYINFSSTGQFDAEGNAMSMIYGDSFEGQLSLANKSCCFWGLFADCTITNAENLVLPATTLGSSCYRTMFNGCTSLTTPPELPATTLTISCYESMFQYCSSLTTAPELPATALAEHCYMNMFQGCSSLTTAPELPANTLTDWCYTSMFQDCSSLTTAPELPTTTLAENCYCYMFESCSNLNYIKMLATDISATDCLDGWVDGVAATGTFVKNPAATWTNTGTSGVPTGWTIKYEDTGYVDKTPTDGSYNSVTSQGIKTYVDTLDSTSVKSSTTGLKIEVVAQMPATPDQNTIYLVQ